MTNQILLIDDDTMFRRSIARLFHDSEHTVLEADSPINGITVLTANPDLQVILLDLAFDEGTASGRSILNYVASRSNDYRVIVLTAHQEFLRAADAATYDVFRYLSKSSHGIAESVRFAVQQAFKDLERAELARKVDFLLRVQHRINRDDDVRETLDLICQAIRILLNAYTCHIRVYDAGRGDYHVRGFAGPDKNLRDAFERPRAKGEFFSGKVAETRRAALFDDVQHLSDFTDVKRASLASSDTSHGERMYFEHVASAYVVPVSTGLYGDSVDAILNVSSARAAFFNSERCALVEEFASQATLAVTKDWLQKKQQRAYRDSSDTGAMLATMADEVAAPNALSKIYDVVTRHISAIVQPEIVSIFLYNEATRILENVAEVRGGQPIDNPEGEYGPGDSLTGRVFADGTTILLPNPTDLQPVNPAGESIVDPATTTAYLHRIPSGQLKHYLAVPIRVGGDVRGVLRALNKTSRYYDVLSASSTPRALLDRGFSTECRSIMEITASHLGVAIHNAELLQQRERQVERVHALGAVGRLINSKIEIDELLKVTIKTMAEVMQAEICMLFLKDPQEERVVLKQVFGIPETLLPNSSYAFGEGVTGRVAVTGVPQIIQTVFGEGKYDAPIHAYLAAKHGRPAQATSVLVVPIRTRDQILGVMKVINKVGDQRTYDHDDLEVFQTFADYVGVAIANAQIYKHANDRLAIAERNAALSLLVSSVAHEINNTSGVIPANVDGIRAELQAPSDAVLGMLSVIEDAAIQATEFAKELAGFSATYSGNQRALDINEVIQTATDALQSQNYWDPTTTTVELVFAPTPLVCEVFRTPFVQVVRNIVINAVQALEHKPGGCIRVSTAAGTGVFAGRAVIRFEDNGPGIRREYQTRIFEPAFTTKARGNGVGLWLVRTQLELVAGTIDVESEPDRGAAFIVTIPLAPEEALQ